VARFVDDGAPFPGVGQGIPVTGCQFNPGLKRLIGESPEGTTHTLRQAPVECVADPFREFRTFASLAREVDPLENVVGLAPALCRQAAGWS